MRSEVYNIEPSNIYCDDCLSIMPHIEDKSVDMILCDLPYQVLHKNNPNAQWDMIIPFEPLWEQYKRIIKDNGAIVLFAQGMFTAQLMMSNPKMWRYNLVWDKVLKTGFLNANRMPLRQHEDICVFYKSLPTYNPQMAAEKLIPYVMQNYRGDDKAYIKAELDLITSNKRDKKGKLESCECYFVEYKNVITEVK